MKSTPLFCFLIALGIWASASSGTAQDQAAEELSPIFVSGVGNPAGMKVYAPGRWGLASVVIGNRTDVPQVVQATARVKGWEELRYSRNVVVPPRSIRQSTIPVHIPEGVPLDSSIEILGLVAADDRVSKSEFDCPARIVSPTDTAFIEDHEISFLPWQDRLNYPYETVLAVRTTNRLTRTLVLNDQRMLPSTIAGWDAVRSIVLSGNRISHNPAARQALREWLSQGGRMWIQADETSVETIRLLLGSALSIEQVDRVPLHDFVIERSQKDSKSLPTVVQLEEPVEFTRVFVEGAQVLYEIDGWPAMMKVDFGLGQVYLTFLEGRGLIRRRSSEDPKILNPLFYTDFVALEPLRQLAVDLRESEVATPVPENVRAEYVTQRIGYKIPQRKLVVNVLLGFCGLIGMAGVGLSYFGLREHLLWVTLAAAALATTMVVALGLNSHHDVPATASSFQAVEVFPEMNEMATSGSVALYQSDLGKINVSAEASTRLNPQSARLSGKIRNFVWSDSGHWQWNDTVMPMGVQLFDVQRYEPLPQPVTVTARFTSQGVAGRLDVDAVLATMGGEHGGLSDALLVFPRSSPLAANLNAEGTFTASSDDVLPPNEFFNSTFVDSSQRQRRAAYQAWYSSYRARSERTRYLLAWSDSLDSGLQWDPHVHVSNGSLLAVPLSLERTPGGTKVSLPGSTVQAQVVASESGLSNTFENATGSWVHPYGRPTKTRLRFQLPDEVLPLKVDSASLFIDCSIPSRVLTIDVIEGDQRRTIVDRANPSGKFTFDLGGSRPLSLDQAGGLTIEFTISDLTIAVDQDEIANGTWSIRTTRLDVTGTTAEIAEVESQP